MPPISTFAEATAGTSTSKATTSNHRPDLIITAFVSGRRRNFQQPVVRRGYGLGVGAGAGAGAVGAGVVGVAGVAGAGVAAGVVAPSGLTSWNSTRRFFERAPVSLRPLRPVGSTTGT